MLKEAMSTPQLHCSELWKSPCLEDEGQLGRHQAITGKRRPRPRAKGQNFFAGLPSETYLDIFSWLPADSRRCVQLSHVCRLWREITVGAAFLWTDLIVRDKKMGDNHSGRIQRLGLFTETCISRARGLPMTLKAEDRTNQLNDFLNVILQAAGECQWSSISLTANDPREIVPFLRHFQTHITLFRYLSVLSLILLEEDDEDDDFWAIFMTDVDYSTLTCLQRLELDASNTSVALSPSILWSQITSLILGSQMSAINYLSILGQCSNLLSCTIRPEDDVDSGTPRGIVTLPGLKTLIINSYTLSPIFAFLITPVLERLEVTCADLYNIDWDNSFVAFVKSCSSTLKQLQVTGILLSVTEIFHDLNVLEELRIIGPYGIDDIYEDAPVVGHLDGHDFFAALTPERMHSLPLPRLHTLEFDDLETGLTPKTRNLLVRIVAQRCGVDGSDTTKNLRKVKLSAKPDLTALWLKEAQEQGLDIDIDPALGVALYL